MSAPLDRVLEKLIGGDGKSLEGFGVVCANSRGPLIEPGIFKYGTRIEIAGDGRVRMTVVRSLSDRPGGESGVYEIHKDKAFVLHVAELLKSCRLEEIQAQPASPMGAIINISVVAGGTAADYSFASSDAAATKFLKPLLNEIVALSDELEGSPIMTLGVDLIAPTHARIGNVRFAASLDLHNSGTQGYWLTHPSRLTAEHEGCELIYGKKPEVTQETMPEPLETQRAPLTAPDGSQPDLLWMAPSGRARVELAAQVNYASPGNYFMRAGYACYSGGGTLGGQPHFVGAAFSTDIEVIVS